MPFHSSSPLKKTVSEIRPGCRLVVQVVQVAGWLASPPPPSSTLHIILQGSTLLRDKKANLQLMWQERGPTCNICAVGEIRDNRQMLPYFHTAEFPCCWEMSISASEVLESDWVEQTRTMNRERSIVWGQVACVQHQKCWAMLKGHVAA